MNRKEFLSASLRAGVGCCALRLLAERPVQAADAPTVDHRAKEEKDFTDGWLTDLLATMKDELDETTRIKLIEGCGRGCYKRHAFKGEIAVAAGGTIPGLVQSLGRYCETWLVGDAELHVRFGEELERCFCPVLRDSPPPGDDLHCHCTKATQRMIMETALGRPIRGIEVVESVRRGGRTCHIVAQL